MTLTDREKKILAFISKGLTNKEIAKELMISEHTAKIHISSILSKFKARNRAQAVFIATKQNMF